MFKDTRGEGAVLLVVVTMALDRAGWELTILLAKPHADVDGATKAFVVMDPRPTIAARD